MRLTSVNGELTPSKTCCEISKRGAEGAQNAIRWVRARLHIHGLCLEGHMGTWWLST